MAILPAILMFWAIVLVIASFQVDDPKIFWVQRLLAFILLVGVFGVLYA